MRLVATILDDTVVYFRSTFLPADVLHPLNTLCACKSQYLTHQEMNIIDVRWRLAQAPQLAVKEVPWWRHVYRLFHAALLDIINTTTKASCVYEFLVCDLRIWAAYWRFYVVWFQKGWGKCDTFFCQWSLSSGFTFPWAVFQGYIVYRLVLSPKESYF